eukprot:TRINITY_DN8163_c0_g1_i1.p1 TRINITY_DN8163_c0_g1~~TRINITY_DN8163_c0_g1_i1.p1  ORF type:complete len:463 (+),score=125.01 TRINITY_DN8163_c0_g1_i1:83-1390(+)
MSNERKRKTSSRDDVAHQLAEATGRYFDYCLENNIVPMCTCPDCRGRKPHEGYKVENFVSAKKAKSTYTGLLGLSDDLMERILRDFTVQRSLLLSSVCKRFRDLVNAHVSNTVFIVDENFTKRHKKSKQIYILKNLIEKNGIKKLTVTVRDYLEKDLLEILNDTQWEYLDHQIKLKYRKEYISFLKTQKKLKDYRFHIRFGWEEMDEEGEEDTSDIQIRRDVALPALRQFLKMKTLRSLRFDLSEHYPEEEDHIGGPPDYGLYRSDFYDLLEFLPELEALEVNVSLLHMDEDDRTDRKAVLNEKIRKLSLLQRCQEKVDKKFMVEILTNLPNLEELSVPDITEETLGLTGKLKELHVFKLSVSLAELRKKNPNLQVLHAKVIPEGDSKKLGLKSKTHYRITFGPNGEVTSHTKLSKDRDFKYMQRGSKSTWNNKL